VQKKVPLAPKGGRSYKSGLLAMDYAVLRTYLNPNHLDRALTQLIEPCQG
jgi:hypothetical protein